MVTCFQESALIATLRAEVMLPPVASRAVVLLLATPMSTPAPTPTNPAPTPPAIVIVFILSSAETLTSRPLEAVPARVAWVVTLSRVTPTGTATPTKPAPRETTRPKTFSLEPAWMASPRNVSTPKPPELTVPSEMPLSPLTEPALAVALLPPASVASVSLWRTRT